MLRRFAGEPNTDYVDAGYNRALDFHRHMEDEINQTIHGSIRSIIVAMFEYLKNFVEMDWRLNEGYEAEVDAIVDEYNSEQWERYAAKIREEEQKFLESGVRSKAHGEEYEISRPPTTNIFGHYVPASVEKKTNSWFYCNTNRPEYLADKVYLPQYFTLMYELISSFRKACCPYIERYARG